MISAGEDADVFCVEAERHVVADGKGLGACAVGIVNNERVPADGHVVADQVAEEFQVFDLT